MAAVTGAVSKVFNTQTPAGPKKTSAGAADEMCFIEVTYSGTYAAADDGTITKAVIATAIQDSRRDGKTVTVHSIAPVAPGDEAGAVVFAAHPSLSGSTFTNALLQANKSTEHADGAMGAWNHGIHYAVNFTAA